MRALSVYVSIIKEEYNLNEVEIVESLYKELLGLGYPAEAIRREVRIQAGQNHNMIIDLAIVDLSTDEIQAIVEIKRGRRALTSAANQVIRYAKAISPNVLCYVYVRDEQNLEIAQVNPRDGFVNQISSFPNYDTLQATYNAVNNATKRLEKTVKNVNYVKRLSSVIAGLSSTIAIGIIASMIFSFASDGIKTLDKSELTQSVLVLEKDLEEQKSNLIKMGKSLEQVNQKLELISEIPESHGWKVQSTDLTNQILEIQASLRALENALTVNPEKALAVPILRKDLDNAEKNLRSELQQTRNEINRMYDLNKWFIGLMFTMAVSVLGIAISSFFNKSDT